MIDGCLLPTLSQVLKLDYRKNYFAAHSPVTLANPSVLQYEPAVQLRQSLSSWFPSPLANVPAGQRFGMPVPSGQYRPSGQICWLAMTDEPEQ